MSERYIIMIEADEEFVPLSSATIVGWLRDEITYVHDAIISFIRQGQRGRIVIKNRGEVVYSATIEGRNVNAS